MNDSDVADFLLAHPAFFERHAELLGRIRLANPHGNRAISLPERQIEMLREKNRQLERRLGDLVRYGHENDGYAAKFDRWATRLLAIEDPAALPDAICDGLQQVFDVPMAAVRLWHVAADYAALPAAQIADADSDIQRFTDSLGTPYCGANDARASAPVVTALAETRADAALPASAAPTSAASTPVNFAAAAWLIARFNEQAASEALASAAGADTRTLHDVLAKTAAPAVIETPTVQSIALIPLRPLHATQATNAFGLLAVGSPDPERFQKGMATDLLIRIGTLAGAALSRLLP